LKSVLFSRYLPVLCAVLIVVLVGNLFYLGAKPIAVGLFPEPWDKLAHATTFGVLAVLWNGVFRGRRPWLVLALVALTGACDEIHQIWLPGRSADIADVLADVAGAGLVLAALRVRASFRTVRGP
jgi:hypothetical protein